MPTLADRYGRAITYIRVSVTDRCNLNCLYCDAGRGQGAREDILPKSELLTFEEIFFTLETARNAFGIKNIRLTGGEPLSRRGVDGLIRRLANEGFKIGLTTNGTLLGREALNLKSAGLSRINISLDTLSSAKYRKLTGGEIRSALEGIEAARKAGFDEITVNAVAQSADYDDAAFFLDWALGRGLKVKFIEEMPIGGRKGSCGSAHTAEGNIKARNAFDFAALEDKIVGGAGLVASANPGFGPGRYYRRPDAAVAEIGFVAALSKPFCRKCNRVRLTSDGKLLPCLGHPESADIKKTLRSDLSSAEKRKAVAAAFEYVADIKPKDHDDFVRAGGVRMSSVGG